jgi:hypothetical protein
VPISCSDTSTENDNLRNEYATLFSHVEKDIPWARIALQQTPDAINLWIGNSLSTTALHKDNYENIYVQIIGQKHFVLLPSLAYACANEMELNSAHYSRTDDGFEITREENDKVPFATWDPDSGENGTQYSKLARPVRATLEEGDMLYLPALWYVRNVPSLEEDADDRRYHKVSQSSSKEGICCAVNYWYVLSTLLWLHALTIRQVRYGIWRVVLPSLQLRTQHLFRLSSANIKINCDAACFSEWQAFQIYILSNVSLS